jgi:hypothetical protein
MVEATQRLRKDGELIRTTMTPSTSVDSLHSEKSAYSSSSVLLAARKGQKDLEKFPRVRLAHLPTPLEFCPRLSEALGGVAIYVKRDDCTGLATGGNKARKLGEHCIGILIICCMIENIHSKTHNSLCDIYK